MGPQISSGDLQGQPRKSGVIACLVSGIWLIASLLVLHAAFQRSDLSSSQHFIPQVCATVGVGAMERADAPSLQPRPSFGSILRDGRNKAPKRELYPDSTEALVPLSSMVSVPVIVEHPWPVRRGQPRSATACAFEARGPPSIT